jgi:hypothetical protein
MHIVELDPSRTSIDYKEPAGGVGTRPATDKFPGGCFLRQIYSSPQGQQRWEWLLRGSELIAYCTDPGITRCEVLCAKHGEGLGSGAIVLAIYVPPSREQMPMVIDLTDSLNSNHSSRLHLACRIRMAFGARGVQI